MLDYGSAYIMWSEIRPCRVLDWFCVIQPDGETLHYSDRDLLLIVSCVNELLITAFLITVLHRDTSDVIQFSGYIFSDCFHVPLHQP